MADVDPAIRPKLLLTNPVHPDADALLAASVDLLVAPDVAPDTLRRLAGDVDGIVVRSKLPDDILAHAPLLKGIVRHGVGLDFIPVAAATAAGVPVANLPGSNTQAVAEYVIGALLALRRPLAGLDATLRRDGWAAARPLADGTGEIAGSTLGILGVGEIGRRVAAIAGNGFGMRVLGASRTLANLPDGVEPADLDRLFADSDAVVVACPLNEATRGMVDARLIGLMKPHALLINVARAAVVDTAALVAALHERRIGGAAVDVHDVQPLAPDAAILAAPNVLATPHVAGVTATSLRAMSMGAAEEMLRILAGERPKNLVNPDCYAAVRA